LALIVLGLIWGASFLLIKVAIQDNALSPTMIAFIRCAAGCIALGLIMAAMRKPLVGKDWKRRLVPYAIMAVTGAVVPWAAIAWGEERVTSGMASILNATTPLFVAVLAYWVTPAERPSLINYAGVVIGVVGVTVLVAPQLAAAGLSGDALGAGAVLLASLAYATNVLYQRRKLRDVDVYELSISQLAVGAVIALPLAAPTVPSLHLSLLPVAAALTLGAVGTGVAYLLYFYAINSLGPVRGSGVTFIVPITAVFWGAVLLHENVTIQVVAGMLVILVGIVLTNLRGRRPARQPAVKSDSAAA
jgi:drug/metabolite transporter (DMT)-like permease